MCLNGLIRFNFILENISDAKLHIIISNCDICFSPALINISVTSALSEKSSRACGDLAVFLLKIE